MDTVFNPIDVWLIKLNSNLIDKMILINIGPNDWSTSFFIYLHIMYTCYFQVREVLWNTESNILCVWLENRHNSTSTGKLLVISDMQDFAGTLFHHLWLGIQSIVSGVIYASKCVK